MNYVLELIESPSGQPITRTEKFILLVLADHHNDGLDVAWPSLARLAKLCLISKRGLLNNLKSLASKDLVGVHHAEIAGAKIRGRGALNVYSFKHLPPRHVKGEPSSLFSCPRKGEARTLEKVKIQPAKGEVSGTPKRNSSGTEKENQALSGTPDSRGGWAQDMASQADAILVTLNRATRMHFKARHPNGELTRSGELIIALLMKGYTVDQLDRVLKLKCRAWLGGDMQRWLRPKTLFCPTNFCQYVAGLAEPVETSAPAAMEGG